MLSAETAWTQDAGLPWTAAHEARRAGYGISNAAAAVALRTVTRYLFDTASIKNYILAGSNPNAELEAAVAADATLASAGLAAKMTETEIISRGYWVRAPPVTHALHLAWLLGACPGHVTAGNGR